MRPLDLGETIDTALKVVRRRWRTLAAVMVVVALPIQLLDVAVIGATTDTYQVGSSTLTSGDSATRTTYADAGVYVTGQIVVALLGVVSTLLGTLACYGVIVADRAGLAGRPGLAGDAVDADARASLRFAARRIGPALRLTLLLVLGLVVAGLALVLPAIWLGVAWSVALPVLLVEGVEGTGALRRSFALVKDRWWATLGRLLVAYILVAVVSAAVSAALLVAALAVLDDTSLGALLAERATELATSLVTTPFIATVTLLVYFDLRARKEGAGLPAASAAHPYAGTYAPPVAPPARPRPAAAASEEPGSGWAPPVAPEPRRPGDE